MLNYIFCLYFLSTVLASAVMTEVISIYQPLSLHGTDHSEAIEGFPEEVQAGVYARPFAISGALPEVLITAVGTSHKLKSLSGYAEPESNIVQLCGLRMRAELSDEVLAISINVSEMRLPKDVDFTESQAVQLVILALRKTLQEWARDAGEFVVKIAIKGAKDEKEKLKALGQTFIVGTEKK